MDNLSNEEKGLQLRQFLRKINARYNERIRLILQGGNIDYSPLQLGPPSPILLNTGIPDLPIEMSVHRLIDKKLQNNHPFSLVSVVNMPECIQAPLAIFKSKTRIDSKVILTDMEENEIHFVIALEMNREKIAYRVNDIRSVYPKDNFADILRWIARDNLLEYADKQKALKWLGKQQSNSAEVARLLEDSTNLINSL